MIKIIGAAVLAALFTACALAPVKGNGEAVILEGPLEPFSALDVTGKAAVRVHAGAESRYTVSVDSNLTEYLDISVVDGRLNIGPFKRLRKNIRFTIFTVDVWTGGLESVAITGSGSVLVEDDVFERGGLDIDIRGSGDVDAGSFPVETASVAITGSGKVRLWCEEKLSVKVLGSGEVVYKGRPELTQRVTGSGSVTNIN
jgi:hypothetical protein